MSRTEGRLVLNIKPLDPSNLIFPSASPGPTITFQTTEDLEGFGLCVSASFNEASANNAPSQFSMPQDLLPSAPVDIIPSPGTSNESDTQQSSMLWPPEWDEEFMFTTNTNCDSMPSLSLNNHLDDLAPLLQDPYLSPHGSHSNITDNTSRSEIPFNRDNAAHQNTANYGNPVYSAERSRAARGSSEVPSSIPSTMSSPASIPDTPPLTDSSDTEAVSLGAPSAPISTSFAPSSTGAPAQRRRRRFSCIHPHCDRRFTSEYTRKVHMGTHEPKVKKALPCTMGCSEMFSRQHDRLRHEVALHGKPCEWSCQLCRRFFSSSKMLEIHKCHGAASRWAIPAVR